MRKHTEEAASETEGSPSPQEDRSKLRPSLSICPSPSSSSNDRLMDRCLLGRFSAAGCCPNTPSTPSRFSRLSKPSPPLVIPAAQTLIQHQHLHLTSSLLSRNYKIQQLFLACSYCILLSISTENISRKLMPQVLHMVLVATGLHCSHFQHTSSKKFTDMLKPDVLPVARGEVSSEPPDLTGFIPANWF